MKKLGLAISILTLLFFVPQVASAISLEASIGGWKQDPSGNISYKGESLDVEDELRYDSKTKVFGRIKIETPLVLPNIYLMATPMKFEEDGSRSINFTFGDTTFDVTAPFSSKVQLDHYDIAFYYNLPLIKTATLKKLNIELGLNARIIDFEGEVSGQDTSTGLQVTESKSLTLPIPMLYVGFQLNPIKLIAFEAEARGIAYSSNHYYDLIGRVKIRPLGPLFISGGYRYEDIKIDKNNVKADFKLQGPFIETGVEF